MSEYTVTESHSGSKSGSYNVNAGANRRIVTADVLDYDGYDGNYALIWKKITITHAQTQTIVATSQDPSQYHAYCGTPWCDQSLAWTLTYDKDDHFTSNSTRTVEFWLTYKVKGQRFDRLICTCSMQSDNSKVNGTISMSQTFSGTRVWGVSIQAHADFIVYQFKKEDVVDGANRVWGDGYDGNHGFESWMTDRDENPLWKIKSHIVGLINISDGADSVVGYLKEEEYIDGAEGNPLIGYDIYSVGVVNE